jgi:polar amino acid transport system substrate-binding protein
MDRVPPDVVKDLAPDGRLRAAINVANPVLVQTDPANGAPRGVTMDLARELARRLGVALEPVVIDGAGKAFAAVKASPLKTNAEVDRAGMRIAVNKGAAYDLFLTRSLKQATLVRAEDSFDAFLRDRLDVVAGVKQAVARFAQENPGLRLIPGRFMEIEQAMCLPKGRPLAARYLRGFVEEMKASAFVAEALRRANQPDATVAAAVR